MPFILSKRGTHNIHKYESMVNFMGNFVEIENQNNTSVKFCMNQIDRIFFFFFAYLRVILDVVHWELSHRVGRNVNWETTLQINLNSTSWWCESYGPASPLLGIYPREILSQMSKESYKRIFIAALFMMSKKLGTIKIFIIDDIFHIKPPKCKN